MLTPSFHFDILKSHVPVMNEVTNTLLDMLQEYADKGETFNMVDCASLYTLDVLLKCAFSDDNSNCLAEKENNPYVKAIHEISKIPMMRFLFPPYHYDWIFNLSPLGYKQRYYIKTIHDYTEESIMRRRKQLLENAGVLSGKYMDFLDILLSAKDEYGKHLTDVEIRDQVNTFMFAGYDTTATAICWIMYCLAINPDHQEKCRRETREVLSSSDDITWEDLNKLEYVTMCIKETMRLYPPVPVIARDLSKDYDFSGYKIQKGTSVSINILAHHHNPNVWPDPERFDPLRFTAENIKSQDPFAYTPFSAGPRNCIGQHFAMLELKVATAHIVNRFHVEVDPSHKVVRRTAVILRPKHGIMINLHPV